MLPSGHQTPLGAARAAHVRITDPGGRCGEKPSRTFSQAQGAASADADRVDVGGPTPRVDASTQDVGLGADDQDVDGVLGSQEPGEGGAQRRSRPGPDEAAVVAVQSGELLL
jgi:hypothetical protein